MKKTTPTIPTDTQRDRLLRALRKGAPLADAARYASATQRQLKAWLRDDGLRLEVDAAQEEAKLVAAGAVLAAAESGDWKAAAWWLERRAAEGWTKGAAPTKADLSRYVHLDDVAKLLAQVGDLLTDAIEDEAVRSVVTLRLTDLTRRMAGAA